MPGPLGRSIGLGLAGLLLLLVGCENGGSRRVAPPSELSFAALDAVLLVGDPVYVAPTFSGGIPTSFRSEPALPAGLSLDPMSGVISGTPVLVTTVASYSVIASNAGGETETILTITVNPPAPCALTYSDEDALYVAEVSAVSNLPTLACGPADTWTIDPALPAGLNLDPGTGAIEGDPTEVIPRTAFTVTAANVTGESLRMLHLEVETPAPCGLSYSEPNAVYSPSVPIVPNIPTSACGTVDTWSIDPPLAPGLDFDPATGAIGGTPTVERPEVVHTVTATNTFGATTTEVRIRISPVFDFIAEDIFGSYSPASGDSTLETRIIVEESSDNLTFPTPIMGLSFALGHDPTHLVPTLVTPGADLLAFSAGDGPDYFQPMLAPNAVTIGVIFTFDLSELLIADVPREIALVEYSAIPTWLAGDIDGSVTTLTWGNPNPTPPVRNEVGLSGTVTIEPRFLDATVSLTPDVP